MSNGFVERSFHQADEAFKLSAPPWGAAEVELPGIGEEIVEFFIFAHLAQPHGCQVSENTFDGLPLLAISRFRLLINSPVFKLGNSSRNTPRVRLQE